MTNNELRTILTAQQAALQDKANVLSSRITALTPQPMPSDARTVMYSLGFTAAAELPPDPPYLQDMKNALQTLNDYNLAGIASSLAALPADDNDATITMLQVMAWDMVGDSRFADVAAG